MQSLKNTKSKPIGRPPKLIRNKPYKSSKRNTIIFLALVFIALILAFKAGANTVNEPIQNASESATIAEPTPTPYPLMQCDPLTSQITDGTTTKECIKTTPTPTPKPQIKSLIPSNEEIVAYIQSKDWDDSTAVRVAKSENFFNLSNSFNCSRVGVPNQDEFRSIDYGIFQVNDYWHRAKVEAKYDMPFEEAMKDCYKNIDYAYEIYTSRGNWSAWSAHNNGSYLAHSDTL